MDTDIHVLIVLPNEMEMKKILTVIHVFCFLFIIHNDNLDDL